MRRKKLYITLVCSFIVATILSVFILLNSNKILTNFKIISVDNNMREYTVKYERVKAAVNYRITIYDQNDIKIYDVKMNNKKEYDEKINSNFITFASSSGVNAFFENGFSLSDSTEIICIGEVTSQALIKKGIDKFYISDIQNVQGIIDTILREVKNEQIQTYESE